MAKRKNKSRQSAKKRRNDLKITKQDVQKGQEAIKTMLKGALILGLFMAFFAFRVQGQTMYERVSSIFAGDEPATATSSTRP